MLSNLALLLVSTDRPAEAEALFHRALAIDEHNFGQHHPKVAATLYNLAHLLSVTNRPAEAEPLMRRTLQIFVSSTRLTGRAHPDLQEGYRHYAELLRALGRTDGEIRAAIESIT